MGSGISQPFINTNNIIRKNNKTNTYCIKLLTYNVEWGFLDLPDNIKSDSCGHNIPQTTDAQEEHLKLISRDIGIVNPDICFLQEMGSLDDVKYVSNYIKTLFNEKYYSYYSNKEDGNQGIGLLIKTEYNSLCQVEHIPNFPLERALGITLNFNDKIFKFVGVHLKSLYDQKYEKDVAQQLEQLKTVNEWIGNTKYSVVCGDMNNIPGSEPILKMGEYGYTDILDTKCYIPSIVNSKYTEFHGNNGDEQGSRIDYIFTKNIKPISSYIINLVRENINQPTNLRKETSDHLPVLAVLEL